MTDAGAFVRQSEGFVGLGRARASLRAKDSLVWVKRGLRFERNPRWVWSLGKRLGVCSKHAEFGTQSVLNSYLRCEASAKGERGLRWLG